MLDALTWRLLDCSPVAVQHAIASSSKPLALTIRRHRQRRLRCWKRDRRIRLLRPHEARKAREAVTLRAALTAFSCHALSERAESDGRDGTRAGSVELRAALAAGGRHAVVGRAEGVGRDEAWAGVAETEQVVVRVWNVMSSLLYLTVWALTASHCSERSM